MEIEQHLYDLNDSGDAIVAYTMRSASGGFVQLCNLGASLLGYTLVGADGVVHEIASARSVLGLSGLTDDRERFGERLWESRVEFNRVIMSLSYDSNGVGVRIEVVFDYDDEDSFEVTYQAVVDSDMNFDLSHQIDFSLGEGAKCEVLGAEKEPKIYDIEGAKSGILSKVATLHTPMLSNPIEILSSQPSLYYSVGDDSVVSLAPVTTPASLLVEGKRFVQKSVFRPILK
ncbi:MAG: hypothetical protein R3Y16_01280 [Rikenellaceae bacterium]